MFDRIIDKIEQVAKEKQREMEKALARFEDPIAKEVGWSPIRGGGASFQTQYLKTLSNNQLKVVKTKQGLLFNLLFMVTGAAVIIGVTANYFNLIGDQPNMSVGTLLLLLLFGGVFLSVGLFARGKSLTFDKSQNYCWQGKRSPREVMNVETKDFVHLNRIIGLQILKESVSSGSSNGKSRSYYSYELNLILDDHERMNVMDHGKLQKIREDGEKLSKYLEVPLFDITR